MGRGKIEIKRIENVSNRQVTYSKRRNGLIKKAKEITVLCDAHVSLIIFASSGKMHDFCSLPTTLSEILEKYHKQSGKRLWDAKHENLSNEIDRMKKENDNMQIELRHLRGEDITSLNYKELMILEEGLQNGISRVTDLQSEYRDLMKRKGKMAEDENQRLHFILMQQQQQEEEMKGLQEMTVMEGYHHHSHPNHHQHRSSAAAMNMRDNNNNNNNNNNNSDHQMPFSLIPLQPNLH